MGSEMFRHVETYSGVAQEAISPCAVGTLASFWRRPLCQFLLQIFKILTITAGIVVVVSWLVLLTYKTITWVVRRQRILHNQQASKGILAISMASETWLLRSMLG